MLPGVQGSIPTHANNVYICTWQYLYNWPVNVLRNQTVGRVVRTDLGQDGPVSVEADHPGGQEVTALHVHRADERQAGARPPRLHPQLQLLHAARRGQHKHPLRVHLAGQREGGVQRQEEE